MTGGQGGFSGIRQKSSGRKEFPKKAGRGSGKKGKFGKKSGGKTKSGQRRVPKSAKPGKRSLGKSSKSKGGKSSNKKVGKKARFDSEFERM